MPVHEAVSQGDFLFDFAEVDAPGLAEAGGVGGHADAGADLGCKVRDLSRRCVMEGRVLVTSRNSSTDSSTVTL